MAAAAVAVSDPNQIFIVLVCVAVGIFGGVFYDFCYCLRYFFRALWVRILADILFCLLFGGLYLFASVMMELPSLRLYMFAACLFGLFLYLKSCHKIVAFFTEKVYNTVKFVRKDQSECPKRMRAARPRKK